MLLNINGSETNPLETFSIFIIFRLVGLQPILFIKNFHAYALIIILKKLNRIPPDSHIIKNFKSHKRKTFVAEINVSKYFADYIS